MKIIIEYKGKISDKFYGMAIGDQNLTEVIAEVKACEGTNKIVTISIEEGYEDEFDRKAYYSPTKGKVFLVEGEKVLSSLKADSLDLAKWVIESVWGIKI